MSAIPLKSVKAVRERSGGRCEVVINGLRCQFKATEIHHMKKRSSGGKKAQKDLHSPKNLLDCCKGHHDIIERHFFEEGNEWAKAYRISRFNSEVTK